MSELPWLMVHGQYAWIGLVVIAVIVASVIAWWRPRDIASRNRTRALVSMPNPQTTSEHLRDNEDFTLVGTLQCAADNQCTSLDSGTAALASSITTESDWRTLADAGHMSATARAKGVFLTLADGRRVDIDGPLLVLSGSTEFIPSRKLKRCAPAIRARVEAEDAMAVELLASSSIRIATLRAGDRVRVRGRMHQVGGIRGEDSVWTLRPMVVRDNETQGEPIRFLPVAFDPSTKPSKPVVSGPSWPAFARASLAGIVSGFLATVALGEVAYQRYGHEHWSMFRSSDGDISWRNSTWGILASTTPFRRNDALRHALAQLSYTQQTKHIAHQRVGLLQLTDQCDLAFRGLTDLGELTEAIELAKQCNSPTGQWFIAEAQYVQGDLHAASNTLATITDPPDRSMNSYRFPLTIHLLSQQPDRLRKALESAMRASEKDDPPVPSLAKGNDFQIAGQCILDGLAARNSANRDADVAKLIERGKGHWFQEWRCGLMALDLLQGQARIAALESIENLRGAVPRTWTRLATLLRMEADPKHLFALPSNEFVHADSTFEPDDLLQTALPALERPLLERLATQTLVGRDAITLRMQLALTQAVFDAYTGEQNSAQRWARLALHEAEVLRLNDVADGETQAADSEPAEPSSGPASVDGGAHDGVENVDEDDEWIETARNVLFFVDLHSDDETRVSNAWETARSHGIGFEYKLSQWKGEKLSSLALAANDRAPLSVSLQSINDVEALALTGSLDDLKGADAIRWNTRIGHCWRCYARPLLGNLANHASIEARTHAVHIPNAAGHVRDLRAQLLSRENMVPLVLLETL